MPTITAASQADHGAVAAFVELHIEQGPVLENAGLDIGVVTDIVEVGHGTVTFGGQADHAGTTPMDLRQDATRAAGRSWSACRRCPPSTARPRRSPPAG